MKGLRDAPGLHDLRTVMCRPAVHPRTKPCRRELGEPSREDEPAGASVLQQGGLELKSTAWQRAVASGEVGSGATSRVWRGVSVRPQRAHSSAHTAMVDLPEVGSETLWAFATEAYLPVGILRVGLQAGRPYGLALAAVAVDSVEARLPGLASIPSKSRYSRVVKKR